MLIILYLCTFISMMIPSATLALDVYVKNSRWSWNPSLSISFPGSKKDLQVAPNQQLFIGTIADLVKEQDTPTILVKTAIPNKLDTGRYITIQNTEDNRFNDIRAKVTVDVRRSRFGFGDGLVYTETLSPIPSIVGSKTTAHKIFLLT